MGLALAEESFKYVLIRYMKYHNVTKFPGLGILWKLTVSSEISGDLPKTLQKLYFFARY